LLGRFISFHNSPSKQTEIYISAGTALNLTVGKGRDETVSTHATSRNPLMDVAVSVRGLTNAWRLWTYFPRKIKVIPKASITSIAWGSDPSLSLAVKYAIGSLPCGLTVSDKLGEDPMGKTILAITVTDAISGLGDRCHRTWNQVTHLDVTTAIEVGWVKATKIN
jgi:hypothetical protein